MKSSEFYKKETFLPISNYANIPSFESNVQGKEILKAKKIIVPPLQEQPRSLSSQNTFRSVFRIVDSRRTILRTSLKNSSNPNRGLIRAKHLQENVPNKDEPYHELQDLSDMCQEVMKNHDSLKKKLKDQEKIIKIYSGKVPESFTPIAMKSSFLLRNLSPLSIPIKRAEQNDDLNMTFRPSLTPIRKQFRFPRDIFK